MKLHVTGNFGSGKTTLATAISLASGIEATQLDAIVYENGGDAAPGRYLPLLDQLKAQAHWITEGAQQDDDWLRPFLEDADAIVWLDLPVHVCAWRILRRHLAGGSHEPGLHRALHLVNYLRMTHAAYSERSEKLLLPFASKTHRCRRRSDVDVVQQDIVRRHGS
jgi:adenylate kinase family enzyme